jgi:uncharacterized membrane protein YdbT with pleckstrin-like domain
VAFLTCLIRKDQPFSWGVEVNAFQSLKASFTISPLLIDIVDLSKPFVLNIDASDFALGICSHNLDMTISFIFLSFIVVSFFLFEINYEIHDEEISLQKNVISQKVQ